MISCNLYASPLTVLYGASGVGKSSILRAGVVPRLQSALRTAVVYFNQWQDPKDSSFLAELKFECLKSLERQRGQPLNVGKARTSVEFLLDAAQPRELVERVKSSIGQPLHELLLAAARQCKGAVLVVLDQFEDYFLYHPEPEPGSTFEAELASAVNSGDAGLGFVIALRDDWLSRLDRFQGRIPNLLGNTYRLEHLSAAAAAPGKMSPAEDAIRRPLDVYNRKPSNVVPVTIDDELVRAVISQVRAGQLTLSEQAGTGQAKAAEEGDRIETAFLQLVMTRLWAEELKSKSRHLRLSTLAGLGGAKQIVQSHLDDVMKNLPPGEQEICVRMFRYLVTPKGAKISHETADLVAFAERPPGRVIPLLEKLRAGRILRRISPPERYEIFHDVLAPAILDWRTRHVKAQELKEAQTKAEAERRRAEEQARQAGRLRRALGRARRSEAVARVREMVSGSSLNLDLDPELSVLIAAQAAAAACRSAPTVLREAEEQLHRAVSASYVRLTLTVNDEDISHIAWSPDGQRLAIVSEDGTKRLFDVETGKQLGGLGASQTWAVTPASFGQHNWTHRWLPGVGARIYPGHAPRAGPPGSRQNTTFQRIIAKIRKTGAEPRASSDPTRQALSFAWSPDARLLATGSYDDTARVWNISTGKELRTLRGHTANILSIAWSPDGRRLATGSDDNAGKVWDVRTGKELRTLKGHGGRIWSVAWSRNGDFLATGSNDNTTRVWDANSGEELRTLRGHRGSVYAIAWSPDGKHLATASRDRTVKVWDIVLHKSRGAVTSVAWSPDGKRLAIGTRDSTVEIRDAEGGKELLCLRRHELDVSSVAWSPDARWLATGSWDRTAMLWDMQRGGDFMRALRAPHKVWNVAWSPDGEQLAVAGNEVIVWAPRTGKKLAAFPTTGGLLSVAWSPDGALVAIVGGRIELWDAKTRKQLPILKRTGDSKFGVAWSPDGSRLATGSSDGPANIWDIESGRRLQTLGGQSDKIYSVAWSPDGKRLATGHDDHTVQVWDAETGEQRLTLYGHRQTVGSVAWSPDGKRLATGSWDGTVQVYPMGIDNLMAMARKRVTEQPSKEGCKKYLHVNKCPRFPQLPGRHRRADPLKAQPTDPVKPNS